MAGSIALSSYGARAVFSDDTPLFSRDLQCPAPRGQDCQASPSLVLGETRALLLTWARLGAHRPRASQGITPPGAILRKGRVSLGVVTASACSQPPTAGDNPARARARALTALLAPGPQDMRPGWTDEPSHGELPRGGWSGAHTQPTVVRSRGCHGPTDILLGDGRAFPGSFPDSLPQPRDPTKMDTHWLLSKQEKGQPRAWDPLAPQAQEAGPDLPRGARHVAHCRQEAGGRREGGG